KEEDVEIHVRFSSLLNPRLISIEPTLAHVNYLGKVDPEWICPNNALLPDFFYELIKTLHENIKFKGIELFNAQYPFPTLQKTSLGCFCKTCIKEASKKRAVENLIDRTEQDIFKTGFDLVSIQKKARETQFKKQNDFSKLLRKKEFENLFKFRRNSITRFVGTVLIQARKIDQNIICSCDTSLMKDPLMIGHDFSYLLSYQDVVNFWLSKDWKTWKKQFKTIMKAKKQAEGKTKISLVIPSNSITKESLQILKDLEKQDPEMQVNLFKLDVKELNRIIKLFNSC
ncbi:MAG: hypothetical protein ACXQS8_08810, partial [Candidatus Helarchaeales archaeon]